MKLTIIVLLFFFCLLCTLSLGAPLFNFNRLLQNSRYVRKRISGLQPDTVNLTKEELLELFHKLNLSVAIEPPPYSESGSGGFESGDAESGDPLEECSGDEFACKDGSGCIPTDKECDKKFDCKDKSDEDKSYCKNKRKEENKKKCKEDQFTCGNGNCISIYHRCDGEDDCKDGSDEGRSRCLAINCPRPDNVHCPSNGMCIELMFLCDGYQDCPDNWDERVCPN